MIKVLDLMAFLFLMGVMSVCRAQSNPIAVTDSGSLRGLTIQGESTVDVFRGIPYASPPVAMNRWRKPQPVAAWGGIRDAQAFGPRCVQFSTDPDPLKPYSSEDCLYLNVWAPAGTDNTADTAIPVLVWIHGGKFREGAGSSPLYNGAHLAGRGVIVVTFNYRLNSLGFLAHPDLSSEVAGQVSGNYALADALAALKWVNRNIAAFGGDPENITVLGNGAGAELTAGLIASPLAENLFQRAVLQNAGFMGARISRTRSLEQTEGNGERISEIFNKHSLEKLRGLDTREAFYFYPAGGSLVVDGDIIPADLSSIYASGRQNKVDVLIGYSDYTAEHTEAFPPNSGQFILKADRFGAFSDEYLQLFPAENDAQAKASYQASTAQEQAWHMRSLAALQKEAGQHAWVYDFRYETGNAYTNHDPQLPFITGNKPPGTRWSDSDQALAEAFTGYLVNFAATGNPNGDTLPAWPEYISNEPGNVLILDSEIQSDEVMYPSEQVLNFFDSAYEAFLKK